MRKQTVKLPNRRISLRPVNDEACEMHGPWAVNMKSVRPLRPEEGEFTLATTTRTIVGDQVVANLSLKMTDEAVEALVRLWLTRRPIKELKAIVGDTMEYMKERGRIEDV